MTSPSPADQVTLIVQAQTAQRAKNWVLALARWEEALKRFGSRAQPWWYAGQAKALLQLGRLDDAEQVYQQLTIDYPDEPAGYVGLADVAGHKREWALALTRWETCVDQFGVDSEPWWDAGRANALLRLERLDDAEQVYQQLTIDYPEHAAGYAGLADVAVHRKDWALALTRWKACIERFGAESEPWWDAGRANALLWLERLDDAEQAYQQLTIDYPDEPAGYVGLADVAGHKREWALALTRWETCVDQFGVDSEPWWHKQQADALAELGRLGEAHAIFAELARNPASAVLGFLGLAKVSFLCGEMEGCLSYSKQLIQSYPATHSGYRWAMESLLRLGRFEEAVDIFLSAPTPDPDSTELLTVPANYPPNMVLPPLRGDGNNYGFIEEHLKSASKTSNPCTLPVSIIVPPGERNDIFEKTLSELANQTYPTELIEVVLVGEGGGSVFARLIRKMMWSVRRYVAPFIRKYESSLDLRFVGGPAIRSGHSTLRNLGIRAASHAHMVILGGDTSPAPQLIERFMQYLHISARTALFEADLEKISNDLKSAQFPFVELPRCALAFPRSAIDLVGYFDEDIDSPEAADLEFAYRLFNAGFYFIPVHADGAPRQQEAPQDTGGSTQIQEENVHSQSVLQQRCPVGTERVNHVEVIYEVPKVSIVVPAHNVESFIRESVDSVLNQSFHDLEVVICNDGSTDKTLQIIEDCYAENPRVRCVTQPNKGIAAAINAAVAMSRGLYIGQVDGDDILMPQAVERAVAHLDEHDVGVVYGRQELIDRDGNAIREMPSVKFSRKRLLVSMICSHFWMFRKRDWMRIDGCDESLLNCVDYDLMLKLSEVCSFGQIPELTYGYRWHGGNTSIINRPLQEANHVAAINHALQRMGLSNEWEAEAGPVSNPWSTVFRRTVGGNGSTT